jgi:prepilin-type N-terminal cleavage/methylation domain-containing protein
MKKVISDKRQGASYRPGFTLIETIIYLAIVSIMLVSVSYLILDIMSGQSRNEARLEVNYNLRFISQQLNKDIASAAGIASLTASDLVLNLPSNNIIYNFDDLNKKLTRQVAGQPAVALNTDQIEVRGNFFDLSYLPRSQNVGVNLFIDCKNLNNRSDFNASTSANLAVELKGRR